MAQDKITLLCLYRHKKTWLSDWCILKFVLWAVGRCFTWVWRPANLRTWIRRNYLTKSQIITNEGCSHTSQRPSSTNSLYIPVANGALHWRDWILLTEVRLSPGCHRKRWTDYSLSWTLPLADLERLQHPQEAHWSSDDGWKGYLGSIDSVVSTLFLTLTI